MEEGMAGGREQKIIPSGEISGIDDLKGHKTGYRLQVSGYGLKE